MEMFYKIAYLTINSLFLVLYIINLIISITRDIMAKKLLKANPQTISARVCNVQTTKKRTYVSVEFTSPNNYILFSNTYEFALDVVKPEDYPIGTNVELIYNDVRPMKKVLNFPLLLKNRKISLEKGPLFTNCALIVLGLYCTATIVYSYITKKAFTSDVLFYGAENSIYNNWIFMLFPLVIYAILMTYVIESLTRPLRSDNHNYLKIYGIRAKAKVITFKFGRAKGSNNQKESLMKIEYFTNTGEKIETNLNSFLYTETQEEYIDIIYDPKQPKNVVYLRQ